MRKIKPLSIKGKYKPRQYLYGFICTFAILVFGFAVAGLVPFGKLNLMAMDAYAQYFPMLRHFVRSNDPWSFAGGLGFNQISQSAYYTNCLLWYFLKLVPDRHMILAIHFLVVLRMSLASLSFTHYIQKTFKRDSPYQFVFSVAYALSSYNLAFINQFMWLDIVVLLPLLACSLQSMWQEKKKSSYVIILALALYSNFYLAYMLCIFACLYSLFLMFKEKVEWRRRGSFLLKFILSSFLGAGLVAFSLLPTYLTLQETISSTLHAPDVLKLYHPLSCYLQQILPFQEISLAYEAPNIYAGLVTVFLAFVYLVQRKRSRRERLIFIVFLLFSYLSFNLNILDYAWHGFHFPNQLPGRQSFLFVFVILSFAYSAFSNEKLELCPAKKRKKLTFLNKQNIKRVLALLLLLEIGMNAVFTLTRYTWKANHEQYTKYEQDLRQFISSHSPSENEFYRMEFLQAGHNQGLRYGYQGIGYYSSLMSEDAYNFFEKIGMGIYAKNVSTDYIPNRTLNNIFSVRYLIQKKDDPVAVEPLGLEKVYEGENTIIYENSDFLPLIYFVKTEGLQDAQAEELIPKMQNHLSQIEPNQFIFTELTPTYIRGQVILPQDLTLLTGIGNEAGWQIYVDGVEHNHFSAFDYLLASRIEKGKHTIEICYTTPGQRTGIALSLFSSLVFFIFLCVDNCRQKLYIFFKRKNEERMRQ